MIFIIRTHRTHRTHLFFVYFKILFFEIKKLKKKIFFKILLKKVCPVCPYYKNYVFPLKKYVFPLKHNHTLLKIRTHRTHRAHLLLVKESFYCILF